MTTGALQMKKSLKQRFRESFGAFMYERNGMDQLSQFILYLSMFLMIVSAILFSALRRSSIAATILDNAAIVILIFSYFRAFSRKVEKRRKENFKYLNAIYPISNWFRLKRQRFEMRLGHAHAVPRAEHASAPAAQSGWVEIIGRVVIA